MLKTMFPCSAPTHRRQVFHRVRDDATRQAATRGVVQEVAHFHITTCVYSMCTMRLQLFLRSFHLQCVCNRLHHVDIAFAQTLGTIQKRCKEQSISRVHIHSNYAYITFTFQVKRPYNARPLGSKCSR